MHPTVRKLLYDPLVSGSLSLIVPDFSIEVGGETITVPARLKSEDGDNLTFDLHFLAGDITEALRTERGGVLSLSDRLRITGQIEGEIRFSALVFPPVGRTTRSRGTSMTTVSVGRLELPPENDDLLSTDEVRALLGTEARQEESATQNYSAHLIFHGPKLHILDAGTRVTTVHDFLGETTFSSFDTHVFRGNGWEGALIQKGEELHLHVRQRDGATAPVADPIDLVNRVAEAVAFTHGFHHWPVYREIRVDHRVVERWLSAKLNLKQTYLAPISKGLGSSARTGSQPDLVNVIPTITDGLAGLTGQERARLGTLIWNVRSSALGDLPSSTKLLILCAAFDGLMKLIAGEDLGTSRTWRRASDRVGFSWERWTSRIFELWGQHRHDLSHGRLWIPEDAPVNQFFTDYPRLGCAFMTVVAAFCGYEGQIMADPFTSSTEVIRELKV